jgi:DNA-binding CsgD family transcriptional regulator
MRRPRLSAIHDNAAAASHAWRHPHGVGRHYRRDTAPVEDAKGGALMWKLTDAERDIVRLLAAGKSTKQTADMRETAEQTVRTQLVKIYDKTGVAHRGELVIWAIRHGFGGTQ